MAVEDAWLLFASEDEAEDAVSEAWLDDIEVPWAFATKTTFEVMNLTCDGKARSCQFYISREKLPKAPTKHLQNHFDCLKRLQVLIAPVVLIFSDKILTDPCGRWGLLPLSWLVALQ